MADMDIPDFDGGRQTVRKPNNNGRANANASAPVVLSNEDKAALDGQPVKATSNSRLTSAAANTNATLVKNAPGTLTRVIGHNKAAADRYLKLYNMTSAPTVGTSTPFMTITLPAGLPFALELQQFFSSGISFALTTGVADNDTGALSAGDITGLNLQYA